MPFNPKSEIQNLKSPLPSLSARERRVSVAGVHGARLLAPRHAEQDDDEGKGNERHENSFHGTLLWKQARQAQTRSAGIL